MPDLLHGLASRLDVAHVDLRNCRHLDGRMMGRLVAPVETLVDALVPGRQSVAQSERRARGMTAIVAARPALSALAFGRRPGGERDDQLEGAFW